MEKLAEIQQKLKAPKNQRNNFGKYNYRSCEDILEAVKPLLDGAILTLSDEVLEIAGIPVIESTVTIKDGDNAVSVKAQAGVDVNTKGMSISQCFGSSSSYSRKYALNGLFCIDDTKDADATNDHKTPQVTPQVKAETLHDRLKQAVIKAGYTKVSDWCKVAQIANKEAFDALSDNAISDYLTEFSNGTYNV